jgi:predicted nuclease with TOPRIM domain
MAVNPVPDTDSRREAMVAAAAAYDEVQKDVKRLREQLNTAQVNSEAKDNALKQAELALATERNRHSQLQTEIDDVRKINSDLLATLNVYCELLIGQLEALRKLGLPYRRPDSANGTDGRSVADTADVLARAIRSEMSNARGGQIGGAT